MNLRLLGARTIKDVVPAMVDASNIHSHLVAVPHDQLYDGNCTYAFVHLFVQGLTVFQMRTCNMHVLGMSRRRRNFDRQSFRISFSGFLRRAILSICYPKLPNYIMGYRIPFRLLCYSARGTIDAPGLKYKIVHPLQSAITFSPPRHHGPPLLIHAATIQASCRKAATASASASLSARHARSSSARASALNPAEHPACADGSAANASRCMKMSSRYSPHVVCSSSAASGS